MRFWGPFQKVFLSGNLEKSHLRLRARGCSSKTDEKLGFILSSSGGNREKEKEWRYWREKMERDASGSGGPVGFIDRETWLLPGLRKLLLRNVPNFSEQQFLFW